jgi:hypothetical protein
VEGFPVTELSELPPKERVRRFLELAEEARRGAAACRGELREHYQFLAEQWAKLAEDFSDYQARRLDTAQRLDTEQQND